MSSTFHCWNELPEALQHAVGAAVLTAHSSTLPSKDHAAQEQRQQQPCGTHGDAGSNGSRKMLAAHRSKSCVPAARGSCRALREGINHAVTKLSVLLPTHHAPGWLRPARFPRLTRLYATMYVRQDTHPTPAAAAAAATATASVGSANRHTSTAIATASPTASVTTAAATATATATGSLATHLVHLEELPSRLRQLRVLGGGAFLRLSLPPPTPPALPHLTVLELSGLSSQTTLDCSAFPSLQRLVVHECRNLAHISHLSTCTALTHLELKACMSLATGLESDTLRGLTRLQRLELRGLSSVALRTVHLPSVSHTLTHLEVTGDGQYPAVELEIVLLGGSAVPHVPPAAAAAAVWDAADPSSLLQSATSSPSTDIVTGTLTTRTALTHLGLRCVPLHLADTAHQPASPAHLDPFTATPSLQVLDLSHQSLPRHGPDLRGLRQLVELHAVGAQGLRSLRLRPVAASLVTLDVSRTPITKLDTKVCTALRRLSCAQCHALTTLSVCGENCALTALDASLCPKLHAISNLHACDKLRALCVSGSGIRHLPLSQAHASSLEEVHAVGCRGLEGQALALPPGCTALRVLRVQWSGLSEMDVSGCPGLTQLDAGGVVRVLGLGDRVLELRR